jgi:hypothetical protein
MRSRAESGQVLLLALGACMALLVGVGVMAAFGKALLGKSRAQGDADLAAIAGAASMRRDFGRLFETTPGRLSRAAYLDRARAAALRSLRDNGGRGLDAQVSFPDAGSFAPVRVKVRVRGRLPVDTKLGARGAAPVETAAEAEITGAGSAAPQPGEGGGYPGPFAYRQGKPMRPDVARSFDRMDAAARHDGVALLIASAYRSDAEQARLYAEHPDPHWVAPPGHSLHRLATELDLGPSSAYSWLARNAGRFHFVKRYAWEPWHYGYTLNPRSTPDAGRGAGVPGDGRIAVPSFVPAAYAPAIAHAASRWNVSAALLAAQLYAESNFNPFALSPAGARGIAQFMPGTARSYGLADPFDAGRAIDAQAHLMRDLLRRFGAVSLALAAYNAGAGAVEQCGCVPPFPETRAYVARILGLMGGAGEGPVGGELEVRLVA